MTYVVSSSEKIKLSTPIYSSNSVDNKPFDKTGYITEDDFFKILINAYRSTYSSGDDYKWHPGDLYINVLSTLEIVCNTLNSLLDLKTGRGLSDVKDV